MPYSDEDLQSYAEGNFKGNIQDIESFIQQNRAAQQSVELYKNLFTAFSTAYQQDHQPVNLPGKIASAINAKQSAKQAKEARLFSTSIAAMVLIAIAIFVRNIIPAAYTLPMLAGVVIMVLFVWVFVKIEIEERKRIYSF